MRIENYFDDGWADTVTFTTNNGFEIDVAGGPWYNPAVYAIDPNIFDYEKTWEGTKSIGLTIFGRDANNRTQSATTSFFLTNVVEKPYDLAWSYQTAVENSAQGATLGVIAATASDADTHVEWEMVSGHPAIGLDSAGGVICRRSAIPGLREPRRSDSSTA